MVRAYKKGAGKAKGGYNGTEPNAKKGFCKVQDSCQQCQSIS